MNFVLGVFFLFIICVCVAYYMLLIKNNVLVQIIDKNNYLNKKQPIIWICFMALFFVISIICAIFSMTHGDVSVYNSWGNYILQNGIDEFYSHNEIAMPPMFLLLCAGLSGIANGIGIQHGIVYRQCFAILFLLSAWLFYSKLRKTFKLSQTQSLVISVLYLFCPSLLFNSAIWAQSEVFTCTISFMIICSLIENKYLYAFIWLAVGIAFKTQIIFILPCLIVWVIYSMIKKKLYWQLPVYSIGLIIVCWLIYLPVGWTQVKNGNVFYILQIFNGVAVNKSYFSSFALNIWSALGLNLITASNFWRYFSYAVVVIMSALLSVVLIKSQYKHKLLLVGILQVMVVNMFCIAMLERYLMPTIPLMLVLIMVEKNNKLRVSASIITTLHLVVMVIAWTLAFNLWGIKTEVLTGIQYVFAIVNVVFCVIFMVEAVKLLLTKKQTDSETCEALTTYSQIETTNNVSNN